MIYTSILSRVVVAYAKVWVLPLALTAAGLFLIVVAISVRTGLMQLVDLAAAAGVLFVAIWVSLLAVGILFLMGIFGSVLRDLFTTSNAIAWQKYDVPIMTVCACKQQGGRRGRMAGDHRPLIMARMGALFLVVGPLACHRAVAPWCKATCSSG